MQGAERLATKYSKYCYLMTIDTEDFVYAFAEAVPAPTDEAYFARVRELHDASVAIGECSLKCELFKLVRVETSEAAKVTTLNAKRDSGEPTISILHCLSGTSSASFSVMHHVRTYSVILDIGLLLFTGAQRKGSGSTGCFA